MIYGDFSGASLVANRFKDKALFGVELEIYYPHWMFDKYPLYDAFVYAIYGEKAKDMLFEEHRLAISSSFTEEDLRNVIDEAINNLDKPIVELAKKVVDILKSVPFINSIACREYDRSLKGEMPENDVIITTDPSIGRGGIEIVTKPLTYQECQEFLKRIVRPLAELGFVMDSTCGLHFHVSVSYDVEDFRKNNAKYSHMMWRALCDYAACNIAEYEIAGDLTVFRVNPFLVLTILDFVGENVFRFYSQFRSSGRLVKSILNYYKVMLLYNLQDDGDFADKVYKKLRSINSNNPQLYDKIKDALKWLQSAERPKLVVKLDKRFLTKNALVIPRNSMSFDIAFATLEFIQNSLKSHAVSELQFREAFGCSCARAEIRSLGGPELWGELARNSALVDEVLNSVLLKALSAIMPALFVDYVDAGKIMRFLQKSIDSKLVEYYLGRVFEFVLGSAGIRDFDFEVQFADVDGIQVCIPELKICL